MIPLLAENNEDLKQPLTKLKNRKCQSRITAEHREDKSNDKNNKMNSE